MRNGAVRARARFVLSWGTALGLAVVLLPRVLNVSWHGVLPVLAGVRWPGVLALTGLWLLGLYAHSYVLTAAAPGLTHRRAVALNLTGSAVSNLVPFGGAAGVELNRRMMRAWGIDTRAFTGYTFLTNLWDVGSKLLLPAVALAALGYVGQTVSPHVRSAFLLAGLGFVVLLVGAAFVLTSRRSARVAARTLDRWVHRVLHLLGRPTQVHLGAALLDIREQSADLVARGWARMTLGMAGYVALQGLLLALCLHLTGGTNTWPQVLAAFAVERALTVVPITPGGAGVADLGLVSVLLALGGDPVSVASAAILYRLFIFLVEIPVGGGALGLWLLGQRRQVSLARRFRGVPTSAPTRVAHVTDVFLPRLGGIETHVDDLVRHQRARGLDAVVLTPTPAGAADDPRVRPSDPAWVHRLSAAQARREAATYDVVHVHVSIFSPYGVGVARAASRAGVPVLVTVHSMWSGAGSLLRLVLSGPRRWPVAWSAVSSAAAEAFGRSLGAVDVAVLPNAVDVADWRPTGPVERSGRQAPTLISVMRLMPRKRPLQLVRMLEQARRASGRDDLSLVIVGDGPLRGRVERYVRRHGLADRVRITGRLPRRDVYAELAAASIYVAPAPKESFGIAALEARCAGLPVVARRRSGVAEFVRDGVDGLLVDSDTQMVASLAELARDTARREQITRHNRTVAPALDWSDALARTDRLYALAVDRASSSEPVRVAARRLAAAQA